MQVLRNGKRNGVVSRFDEGKRRPGQQDDHHDGGDLHDAESFLAGLLDTLGIFPPVINRNDQSEYYGRHVDVEVRGAMEDVVDGAGNPAVYVGGDKGFVDQTDDVLASRHPGDRSGEDVIEHQGGDAELGQGAAQGFFHDPIDAAADEHGTAF